ncbi:hypothetical protein D9M69_378270 [compost metagenome]
MVPIGRTQETYVDRSAVVVAREPGPESSDDCVSGGEESATVHRRGVLDGVDDRPVVGDHIYTVTVLTISQNRIDAVLRHQDGRASGLMNRREQYDCTVLF